jgi:hypothetical protein
LLWAGLGACVLGVGLMIAQFSLKRLDFVPWYAPALATVGALLLAVAFLRRPGVLRGLVLLLVVVLAGYLWFVLAGAGQLPAYNGPARAGERVPEFRTTLADGRPFTDADLRDGSRRAMVFFRGRW